METTDHTEKTDGDETTGIPETDSQETEDAQTADTEGKSDAAKPTDTAWKTDTTEKPSTAEAADTAETADRSRPNPNLSGAAWWHANQAKYPNSKSVSALEPSFAHKVNAFISALHAAGATVNVSATRRNKIRAYLMYHSWRISKGIEAATHVPAEPGCSIVWNHGNEAASRRGAGEMVALFQITFQPSLHSRHIAGLAIDMSIHWTGTLHVRNHSGRVVPIGAPHDGSNAELHGVGATYGVIKLVSDPPHWSDNGH